MARFMGFKPEGMRKIASKMGYQGSMDDFDSYLQQNPEKKKKEPCVSFLEKTNSEICLIVKKQLILTKSKIKYLD